MDGITIRPDLVLYLEECCIHGKPIAHSRAAPLLSSQQRSASGLMNLFFPGEAVAIWSVSHAYASYASNVTLVSEYTSVWRGTFWRDQNSSKI